jgi:hypothetical protein
VLPLLCVVFSLGFLWVATRHGQHDVPLWFAIVWSAGMLWGSYRSARIPHTIQVTDAQEIRLLGLLGTVVVPETDIQSVKAMGMFVELKHVRGKLLLLQRFTGFHHFLVQLEQSNPRVTITGI